MLDLADLNEHLLSASDKGIPADLDGVAVADVASKRLNVLSGSFAYPVAVLRERAIAQNIGLMDAYVRSIGADIAPHGKTSMCPQLFDRQLEGGAWGITCANAAHLRVYRRFGVSRIIMANQLLDPAAIRFVEEELRTDPTFEFIGIVDSIAGVERYLANLSGRGRPIDLLVEIGIAGGRTGVRSTTEAVEIAAMIARHGAHIRLAGFEAFEGIFGGAFEDIEERVTDLLARLSEAAARCDGAGLFSLPRIILSAGGSGYFDLVAKALGSVSLSRPTHMILRSGCYVTHDHGFYASAVERLRERAIAGVFHDRGFEPALELWAMVQSVPEKGRALLTLGKRDASHDLGLPRPLKYCRPGGQISAIGDAAEVTALNDHHCYLSFDGIPLEVGDLVGLGISHPCTTFDRWRYLHVVDDDYVVRDTLRTFF